MSAGVSNLGMGWDVTRNPSTQIQSDGEIAAQQAAQQSALQGQISAIQTPQSLLNDLIEKQAQYYANYYSTPDPSVGYAGSQGAAYGTVDYWRESLAKQLQPAASNGTLSQSNFLPTEYAQQYESYAGNRNPTMGTGYGHDGTYQAQVAPLQQQLADQNAQAAKANQARQQNQQLQQQGFNAQTGGGFAGGLLNPSYSQPFSGTLGFSGGMMGSGQAPAASTGLNPWAAPAGGSSPSSANSGAWGGPFSAKNPWSLS